MLGAAWAATFWRTMTGDDPPSLTVVRGERSFAALIGYTGVRILAISAVDSESIQGMTERIAGSTRQRLDVLLLTADALQALPVTYRDRWNVAEVMQLPDSVPEATGSLAGRAIQVGDLNVSAHGLPHGQWRKNAPVVRQSWYLDAAFGSARMVIASDAAATGRLPMERGHVTGVVCADPLLASTPLIGLIDLLVVPPDGDVVTEKLPGQRPHVVPLHRDLPTTFRLTRNAIDVSSAY